MRLICFTSPFYERVPEVEKACRTFEKELSAIDRRLAKLQTEIAALDSRFADAHDDYDRLLELQRTRDAYVAEVATLEERWLELGEALDD